MLVANAFFGSKERTFAPGDFFPSLATPKREETDEERSKRLLGMVEILNELYGGRDLRTTPRDPPPET